MESLMGMGGAAAPQGGGSHIKDGSSASFMEDVVQASMETPVLVDFWAPWCGPCKQLTPALEAAVNRANGAIKLVKINVDEAPEISQQLRIQSIPTVYAFHQGQPVDGFQGAVPESQIQELVDRLTDGAASNSPIAQALEEAERLFEAGEIQAAGGTFQQILQHEDTNAQAFAGFLKCLIADGRAEDARQILDNAPDEMKKDKVVEAAIAQLELAEQAAAVDGQLDELRQKVEANSKDHQSWIDLSNALNAGGDREGAVDALLESISIDRAWNEEAARKQLLKLFEAFGPTDPVTMDARRRLGSILFS